MKELAFIVVKDSEFYKQYFEAKAERQKFHELAKAFFEKYDLVDSAKYYQTKFLGLKLTAEQKKRFEGQLKKYDDENGMSRFKQKSAMQKAWNEFVADKVNFDTIGKTHFWWISLINHGSYNLWDKDGNIYGYVKDKHKETIILPEYMTAIKMSEYYSVIEQMED